MPGTCSRCSKSVFHAEETQAIGKIWHTNCFLCANCNKRLNSMNVTDREGEAFCKSCYARLFGPKGYGYAMGAAGSLDLSGLVTESPKTSIETNRVENNNALNNDRKTRSSETNHRSEKHIPYLARSRYSSPTKFRSSSPCRPYKASYQFKNFRYGDKICGRCNKTVYLNENVYGAGAEQSWHQACFKCNKCEKRLDSISVQTYEGEIYCVACSNNYHFARKKF